MQWYVFLGAVIVGLGFLVAAYQWGHGDGYSEGARHGAHNCMAGAVSYVTGPNDETLAQWIASGGHKHPDLGCSAHLLGEAVATVIEAEALNLRIKTADGKLALTEEPLRAIA